MCVRVCVCCVAIQGHLHVVWLLLQHGSSSGDVDELGNSALHVACSGDEQFMIVCYVTKVFGMPYVCVICLLVTGSVGAPCDWLLGSIHATRCLRVIFPFVCLVDLVMF